MAVDLKRYAILVRMTHDSWEGVRATQPLRLAILVFLLVFVPVAGLLGWLRPDLMSAASFPIILTASLAAWVAYRWGRDHL